MTVIVLFAGAVCLLAAAWPATALLLPIRFRESIGARLPWLAVAAPWIRGAGLPYAALVCGSISARGFGLAGQSAAHWLAGALVATVCGAAGGALAARAGAPPDAEWFLAEARWSMYRAAALWLTPLSWILALAGLAGAAVEWMATAVGGRAWPDRLQTLSMAARAAGSLLIFFLAPNFYLAVGMYVFAAAVGRFVPRPSLPPAGG